MTASLSALSINKAQGLRSIKVPRPRGPKLVWQGSFEEELRARLTAIERKLDFLQLGAPPVCRGSAPAAAQKPPSSAGARRAWAPSPCGTATPSAWDNVLTAEVRQVPSPCGTVVPSTGDKALQAEAREWTDEAVPQPAAAMHASRPWPDLRRGSSSECPHVEESESEEASPVVSVGGDPLEQASPPGRVRLSEDGDLAREMSSLRRCKTTANHWQRVMVMLGLENRIHAISESLQDPQSQKGWRWVHNSYVSSCVSCVIVLNSVFMGYRMSTLLTSAIDRRPVPSHVFVIEVGFNIFFMSELLLRLIVERWLFFFGPEHKWNFLDTILVLLSCLEALVDKNAGFNASVGRVLRLLRFFRLARLSKVTRHFDALRLIAYAILDSMDSLFWCCVLTSAVIYVFSMVFMFAVVQHFFNLDRDLDPNSELTESLVRLYGGIFRSMLTLFMVVTGGMDWNDAMKPLMDVDSIFMLIFVCFVFLMFFGVLNVVIGQFVATATEITARDQEALVKTELREWQFYADRIEAFFKRADIDKDHSMTWAEFKEHLKDPKVRALYQTLDLDVTQAHVLFDLLDTDMDGRVTVDEFIDGCMRLKGQAKNLDVNMLLAVTSRLFDQLGLFIHTSRNAYGEIQESLDVLAAQQRGAALQEASNASASSPNYLA